MANPEQLIAGGRPPFNAVGSSTTATTVVLKASPNQTWHPDPDRSGSNARSGIVGTAGTATGGSATTLVDSTKAWTVNAWTDYRVRFRDSNGVYQTGIITSNTATTLTCSAAAFDLVPASGNSYTVYNTATGGTGTTLVDSTRTGANAWTNNQWVGYRLMFVDSNGAEQFATITANNTTGTITCAAAAWGTNPATGNTYGILKPTGAKPVLTSYLVSAIGAPSDATVTLESLSPAGTTTLAVINVPTAANLDPVPIAAVEIPGGVNGNVQFTTSAAIAHVSVNVSGYWQHQQV